MEIYFFRNSINAMRKRRIPKLGQGVRSYGTLPYKNYSKEEGGGFYENKRMIHTYFLYPN